MSCSGSSFASVSSLIDDPLIGSIGVERRMANYLSLEEAAKKLGISTDKLVDLRSQGQVRGFRDGASWKFPEDAIDQLADDLAADGHSPSSDDALVTSDSELLMDSEGDSLFEIDSGELQLDQAAIGHDSGQLDLSVEPNSGSTGPVTDEELDEIAQSNPDVLASGESGGSEIGLSGLDDEDSADEVIGGDEDSAMDVLGGDAGASSLELMDELEQPGGSRGGDVLSELDLLGADKRGSSLISGDGDDLLSASGIGSSIGSELPGNAAGGIDDALADDDELIIADDDDDLVISGAGSDISIAGDSGINLMSPSDSGLSLESEPLDLAGSSISALDLGAELADVSGSGSGGSGGGSDGSLVDFQADEEFQLSPSGIGIDADMDSGSQVIEIEDSEALAEPLGMDDAGMPLGGDVFGEPEEGEALALDAEEEAVEIDGSTAAPVGARAIAGYEVPFSLFQCISLMLVLCVMSLGGMLLTDLVRNMWAYEPLAAPVSSLTDSLIAVMGWGQ
jgi:excisionase family DNA binding protein